MDIHSFIFNKAGHEGHAEVLEKALGVWSNVTVINSDRRCRETRPNWVHLAGSAHFAEKWNAALGLFDGEALFQIDADAQLQSVEAIIKNFVFLANNHKVGVYQPDVRPTRYEFPVSQLKRISRDTYEVPYCDRGCWLISGAIIDRFPPVDLSLNKAGCAIDLVVAAICRLSGQVCIRDYSTSAVRSTPEIDYDRDAMDIVYDYLNTLDATTRQVAGNLLSLDYQLSLIQKFALAANVMDGKIRDLVEKSGGAASAFGAL